MHIRKYIIPWIGWSLAMAALSFFWGLLLWLIPWIAWGYWTCYGLMAAFTEIIVLVSFWYIATGRLDGKVTIRGMK